MKVKLLQELSFPMGKFAVGDDVDLDDAQAEGLIALGLATKNLATDAPTAATMAPAPETGTLPRAKKQ